MIPICEVKIEAKPGWDIYDIWFYNMRHDRMVDIYYFSGSECRTIQIKEGDKLPDPSLSLPRRVLDAFVKTARGAFPPTESMKQHLDDAIKIRDRLLAIVEKNS